MASHQRSARRGGSDEAAQNSEKARRREILRTALAIAFFFLSAAVSLYAFFLTIDLGIWLGSDRIDPVFPAACAFVVLFVVWAIVFWAFMALLRKLGFDG